MARDRQTSLRLEGALLEKLQMAARDNRRTLAAEISLRLEQSFEPTRPDEVLRQIAEASKVLAEAGARLSGAPTVHSFTLEEIERLAEEERYRARQINPYAEADAVELVRQALARNKKEKVK